MLPPSKLVVTYKVYGNLAGTIYELPMRSRRLRRRPTGSTPLRMTHWLILYITATVGEESEAREAVVNDDTVRRQSRRGTEHRSARPYSSRAGLCTALLGAQIVDEGNSFVRRNEITYKLYIVINRRSGFPLRVNFR